METIDLTPTWGEIGNMYARFAECGEVRVIRAMRPDVARALAAIRKIVNCGWRRSVQLGRNRRKQQAR